VQKSVLLRELQKEIRRQLTLMAAKPSIWSGRSEPISLDRVG
jgi:hypothetical protein